MATPYEKRKCLEILDNIDDHIPQRGYVKLVQEVFKKKGLSKPSEYQIKNTRLRRQYNLEIVKALAEISQPRDENDNLITPKKYRGGFQVKVFESANK